MSEQKIPEAAVEAAVEQLNEMGVSVSKKYMRAALEAAAPHMLAEVWDEGAKATSDHEYQLRFRSKYGDDLPQHPTNPYRDEKRKTTFLRIGELGARWEEL